MICGIDLGSRNVKVALMDENNRLAFKIFDTIQFYRMYGKIKDHKLLINFSQLGLEGADKIVSTGYGRQTVDITGSHNIPELKAHLLGAVFQTNMRDFTLLDLGGQDSKVIKVRNGKMIDFETNDKCAASTGRYLENMAKVLEIEINELSSHYSSPVELNSTCAIFGETELVGKIVEGYSTKELCAGINYTIFKRIQPMLRKLYSDKIIFTGGVAYNQALKHIIRKELGADVIVPANPQYNGCIGCCIHGEKMLYNN